MPKEWLRIGEWRINGYKWGKSAILEVDGNNMLQAYDRPHFCIFTSRVLLCGIAEKAVDRLYYDIPLLFLSTWFVCNSNVKLP